MPSRPHTLSGGVSSKDGATVAKTMPTNHEAMIEWSGDGDTQLLSCTLVCEERNNVVEGLCSGSTLTPLQTTAGSDRDIKSKKLRVWVLSEVGNLLVCVVLHGRNKIT